MPQDPDIRFRSYINLIGAENFARVQRSQITVVGMGGVGSWAAESLARCGVLHLTLIDMDHVSLGNTNRQIHAVSHAYGQAKVHAMRDRLTEINPDVAITCIDDFVTVDNVSKLLQGCESLIDACDQTSAKIAMAQFALSQHIPFVMCGSAGGKTDPAQLVVADIMQVHDDPLLRKVRKILKRTWASVPDQKSNISTIFCKQPQLGKSDHGISCTGYGSSVNITAVMGFLAANEILKQLTK